MATVKTCDRCGTQANAVVSYGEWLGSRAFDMCFSCRKAIYDLTAADIEAYKTGARPRSKSASVILVQGVLSLAIIACSVVGAVVVIGWIIG